MPDEGPAASSHDHRLNPKSWESRIRIVDAAGCEKLGDWKTVDKFSQAGETRGREAT